jgi:recombination protein RecA
MKNSAEEVIESLLQNKTMNLRRGDSDEFSFGRIPFNIPVLDNLTGGGIPKKRMTILYGPTNVGKSYLASQVVANAQRNGGTTAWIDTELSWDSAWVNKCGIDASKVMVAQPINGEEAMDTTRELMRSGVDVIVLDSIAGLVPTAVHDEDFSYNPMAWQARFVNSSLPRILPNLKHGSALVAINQVRSSIGPVALDNMPGGLAQSFFAHFLLQVRRSGWIKEGTTNVGFDMEVRLRKSKVGGENWNSATVPFRVEGGIDVTESYIRDGIEAKLITQAGPWYTYKEQKAMGLNGVRKMFSENLELFEVLKSELAA